VPIIWISSQYAAAASQNFTSPGVTGVDPAVTVAVSVTTLPAAMVVTGLPPDVTVTAVVVAVCATALAERTDTRDANTITNLRMTLLSFCTGLQIRGPNELKGNFSLLLAFGSVMVFTMEYADKSGSHIRRLEALFERNRIVLVSSSNKILSYSNSVRCPVSAQAILSREA
jgi:hypothetical protein